MVGCGYLEGFQSLSVGVCLPVSCCLLRLDTYSGSGLEDSVGFFLFSGWSSSKCGSSAAFSGVLCWFGKWF